MSLEPNATGGAIAVLLDRVGALDRRIEEMGQGIHNRLTRFDLHTEKKIDELKGMHERAGEDDEKLDTRISNIERSQAMVKGGIAVLTFLVGMIIVPIAVVVLSKVIGSL